MVVMSLGGGAVCSGGNAGYTRERCCCGRLILVWMAAWEKREPERSPWLVNIYKVVA